MLRNASAAILILLCSATLRAQPSEPLIHLPLDSSAEDAGRLHLAAEPYGPSRAFERGVVGGAIHLGGGANGVRYAAVDSSLFGGDMTVELWARRDVNDPLHITHRLLSFGAFALTADVGTDADRNRLFADFRTVRGVQVRVATTAPVSAAHWTHIALVQDASRREARLYVDGALAGVAPNIDPLPVQARSPLSLGAERETDAFMGWLDDVKIYDRVRTPQEIVADVRSAASGAASPIAQVAPVRPDTIPYRTVFDVRESAAGRQRTFTVMVALLMLLVGLSVLHAAKRINVRMPLVLWLAILFLAAVAIPSHVRGTEKMKRMQAALSAGRFTLVEGRVEELTPPRRNKGGYTESFVVHSGERTFAYRYRDAENAPGFHQTTKSGSPLLQMMRVRIADIDGRIARLEIAPQPGIGQ